MSVNVVSDARGVSVSVGAQGAPGQDGAAGADGTNGWSPVYAVVPDGERRVQEVVDWTGGEGTKPATGFFVGPSGPVTLISDGADIRGAAGLAGAAALEPVQANAYATFNGLAGGGTPLQNGLNAAITALRPYELAHGSVLLDSGNLFGTTSPIASVQVKGQGVGLTKLMLGSTAFSTPLSFRSPIRLALRDFTIDSTANTTNAAVLDIKDVGIGDLDHLEIINAPQTGLRIENGVGTDSKHTTIRASFLTISATKYAVALSSADGWSGQGSDGLTGYHPENCVFIGCRLTATQYSCFNSAGSVGTRTLGCTFYRDVAGSVSTSGIPYTGKKGAIRTGDGEREAVHLGFRLIGQYRNARFNQPSLSIIGTGFSDLSGVSSLHISSGPALDGPFVILPSIWKRAWRAKGWQFPSDDPTDPESNDPGSGPENAVGSIFGCSQAGFVLDGGCFIGDLAQQGLGLITTTAGSTAWEMKTSVQVIGDLLILERKLGITPDNPDPAAGVIGPLNNSGFGYAMPRAPLCQMLVDVFGNPIGKIASFTNRTYYDSNNVALNPGGLPGLGTYANLAALIAAAAYAKCSGTFDGPCMETLALQPWYALEPDPTFYVPAQGTVSVSTSSATVTGTSAGFNTGNAYTPSVGDLMFAKGANGLPGQFLGQFQSFSSSSSATLTQASRQTYSGQYFFGCPKKCNFGLLLAAGTQNALINWDALQVLGTATAAARCYPGTVAPESIPTHSMTIPAQTVASTVSYGIPSPLKKGKWRSRVESFTLQPLADIAADANNYVRASLLRIRSSAADYTLAGTTINIAAGTTKGAILAMPLPSIGAGMTADIVQPGDVIVLTLTPVGTGGAIPMTAVQVGVLPW